MCKKLKLFALIVLVISTMADICPPYPDPPTETPPDVCPSWDTDCDNISDAVETNDANSYLGLDPNSVDTNFSVAHGYPWDGWIENAFNLVNEGTGYSHYNPEKGEPLIDTDDWSVLTLINMIEGAGRDWYSNGYIPPRIGVGDLSKGDQYTQQFGGYFPPHKCHQNGLEVDIRYVRNDGNEGGLNVYTQPSLYDQSATVKLMNFLCWNGDVVEIVVSRYAFVGGEVITEDTTTGHDDHFHVRIEDPDGTGN